MEADSGFDEAALARKTHSSYLCRFIALVNIIDGGRAFLAILCESDFL